MKALFSCLLAVCLMFTATGCWGDDDMSSPSVSAPGTIPGETAPGSAGSHTPDSSQPARTPGPSASGEPDAAQSTDPASRAAAAQAAAPAEGPWALRLVNGSHPLPEDFSIQTKAISGYDQRMFDARAAGALEALLHAAQEEGCPLYLVSAYRSVARQKALFLRKTNFYRAQGLEQAAAEREAARLVARPGTSEHNLGLAADMVSADWYQQHDDLTEAFAQTPEFSWLRQNAARFGFILRYPKGKEALTGVEYEPWHYRYVGPSAAKELSASGQCLEEYLRQPAAPEP